MLTSTAVLLLMSSAYILFEYLTFREIARKNITSLGLIVASNSSAALAFDSPRDANDVLNALKANKQISIACLYDINGKLFAKYPQTIPSAELPAKPKVSPYYYEGSFLQGFQPVMQGNTQLGTLYIKRNLTDFYAQMRINVLIALLMIVISSIVAWILSSILQKSISEPILALEKTAKRISQNHDYSVRATKAGQDELGSLTDAFNLMLAQIEEQNRQISNANEESLKLAAIVESSGDAIIGTSLDLTITSWNQSAERIFGYSAEEMIAQPISKVLPAELNNHSKTFLNYRDKRDEVNTYQTQVHTKSKNLLDISLTISPVKDSAGNLIGLSQIARDISTQKQNERLITENEEHLRLATGAAELGTFDMDLVNDIMNWDERCREIFGITHTNPLTYHDHFLTCLHEEDKERIIKSLEVAYNVKTSKGSYDLEYRSKGFDHKLRWVRAIGKVFFNEKGQAVRSVGILMDITSDKTEEIKKNDFIAIISHELRTPLTSIKSYVQVLLAKAKQEKDFFKINALTRAEVQSNKMAGMIQDFLSLARLEEGKISIDKEQFDLVPVLSNVVEEALFVSSSHTISVNACEDIRIEADKDKISQVLINLVSNAVKYSPPGSSIIVACQKVDGKVKISVSDEGIGISVNDQKKLFNRFYRVEHEKMKTVSGFGIGLYIVAEILKYHESSIKVESEEGRGSTFSFVLDTIAT